MSKHATELGLKENVVGLLAYALGFVSGIVLLIIEKKNRFVRFHAMQSTVTFISLTIIQFILYMIPFIGSFLGWLMNILIFILWIVCMVKAYNHERFKLPIFGQIAENLLKNK